MPPQLSPADLLARANRDVERSLLRARNGLRYVRGTHRPQLGATPKDVVWQRDKAQLWRYRGEAPIRYAQPLLIVTSLVSRSYILDLLPGSSAVEFLRAQGFDVYLLDWGVPDELDADNRLETYVDEYLPRAVDAVLRHSGADELTMAGYCLGGVLSTLYVNGHDDERVRNLILMATPVDYTEMGAMVAAMREGRLDPDDLIDETGNVPADVLYSGFFMLAPTTIVAQRATLLENLWNDEFVKGFQAMAQWARDQVPFPGAAFRAADRRDRARQRAHARGAVARRARDPAWTARTPTSSTRWPSRTPSCRARRRSRSASWSAGPSNRQELLLPGGHVTFGTGRSAFKHTLPAARGVDRRAQRRKESMMEIRQLEPGDREALERFLRRVPEGDRTFFKEDVDGSRGGRRLGAARRPRACSPSTRARCWAIWRSCSSTAGRATSARCA